MADRFVSRIAVSLAAGASTTTAHGLIVNGVAVIPQKIEADRTSPLQISAADDTNITVTNPTKASAVTIFLCTYIHSIQAVPGDTAPGWWWKGGEASSGALGFLASNEYYVDSTIVDSTYFASLRMFSTVALAVAAAETDQTDDYVVRLREGQAHSWDGTGFSGLLNATLMSLGRGSLTLAVGTLAAGTSKLALENLDITHTGLISSTTGHALAFDNCVVTSLTGIAFTGFASVSSTASTKFIGTRFLLLGTGDITLQGAAWEPGAGFVDAQSIFSFNAANSSYIYNSAFNLEGANDAILFSRVASSTNLHIYGTAFTLYNEGAAGNQTLFGGPGMGVTHSGNTVHSIGGSGADVKYGTVSTEGASGITWYGWPPVDNNIPAGALRAELWVTTSPGAASTNTASGVGQFAIGASTCVITNPYVTALSAIVASLQTVDATLTQLLTVVPGVGSFTVTGNAVATAATAFSWQILPKAE